MTIEQVIAFIDSVKDSPHLCTHLESALGYGSVPDESLEIENIVLRLCRDKPKISSYDFETVSKWLVLFDYLQDVVDTFNRTTEKAYKTYLEEGYKTESYNADLRKELGLL